MLNVSYRFCLKDFQKYNQTSWAQIRIIILKSQACKKPTKIYCKYVTYSFYYALTREKRFM